MIPKLFLGSAPSPLHHSSCNDDGHELLENDDGHVLLENGAQKVQLSGIVR